MTVKISQHVVPRHSHRPHRFARRPLQRGNTTPSAIGATLGVGVLIILAVLGFMYLQQVLETASQGTDIHALENELIELKQRQRELELEGANLRSLQTVEDRVQRLHLVPTDHVSYLSPTPEHVAQVP